MTITVALVTILTINRRSIIESVTFRGGFFKTSWSTGSTPRLKNAFAPLLTSNDDEQTFALEVHPWWCWSRESAWRSMDWENGTPSTVQLNSVQRYSYAKSEPFTRSFSSIESNSRAQLKANEVSDIVKDRFAFFDRRPEPQDRDVSIHIIDRHHLHDRVEIIGDKNHVSSFFTHVCSWFTHGDTDIGCFQSHGIIHTITCHAHDVSLRLQRLEKHPGHPVHHARWDVL